MPRVAGVCDRNAPPSFEAGRGALWGVRSDRERVVPRDDVVKRDSVDHEGIPDEFVSTVVDLLSVGVTRAKLAVRSKEMRVLAIEAVSTGPRRRRRPRLVSAAMTRSRFSGVKMSLLVSGPTRRRRRCVRQAST